MKKLFLTSSVDRVARYIAEKIRPQATKLIFVTTASEVEKDDLQWLEDDRKALIEAGFDITDYTITGKTSDQVENDLKPFDVICIEGGNTFYLLEQIQQSGCSEVLRKLIIDGKIYIGSSAGSIIAGPNIYPVRHLDDDDFPHLKGFEGLNLVDFVVFPHWGSEYFKGLYLNRRLEYNYNNKYKYMLLTDNQYLEVEEGCIKFIDVATHE